MSAIRWKAMKSYVMVEKEMSSGMQIQQQTDVFCCAIWPKPNIR